MGVTLIKAGRIARESWVMPEGPVVREGAHPHLDVGLLPRATFDEMVIDAIDRVADRAGQGAGMANHGTTQHDGTDPPGNTRGTYVTENGIVLKQKISIDQGGNLILCGTMVGSRGMPVKPDDSALESRGMDRRERKLGWGAMTIPVGES